MQAFKSSGIQERTSGGREIAPARLIPTLYSALNMTLSKKNLNMTEKCLLRPKHDSVRKFFSSKARSQIWVEKKKRGLRCRISTKEHEQCISMLEARFCSSTLLPSSLDSKHDSMLLLSPKHALFCSQTKPEEKSQHRLGQGRQKNVVKGLTATTLNTHMHCHTK